MADRGDLPSQINAEERIKQLEEDELTGLWGRRVFSERALELMEEVKNSSDQISLLFVDLDYLKRLNDNYGYDVGDDLIGTTAKSLKEEPWAGVGPFENVDGGNIQFLLSRWGGDEFLVLLVGNFEEERLDVFEEQVGANINKGIRKNFDNDNVKKEILSVSVGACIWDKEKDFKDLVSEASKRMKEVKNKKKMEKKKAMRPVMYKKYGENKGKTGSRLETTTVSE